MLRLLTLATSISLVAACQPATMPAGTAGSAPGATPVTDGMVDVGGGLSLHVHCMGSGEPTVLMEAGAGGSGTVWQRVQSELAQVTRVCGYDRAGAGYSDTPPKPRAAAQITRELHTLLARANLGGPYVLVGHSIGGLYMRLYAAEHPGDVAGIVLIDASTEDQDARMWSLLPPEALAAMDNPRDREGVTLDAKRAAMAQLRAANRSLGDKPLVVLTAGKGDDEGLAPDLAARMAQAWQEMQAALPRHSSNSTQVIAAKSGHFIQYDSPKLVIAAVREVVVAVRAHGRIDPAPLRALASE